jgi:hypothetical protein
MRKSKTNFSTFLHKLKNAHAIGTKKLDESERLKLTIGRQIGTTVQNLKTKLYLPLWFNQILMKALPMFYKKETIKDSNQLDQWNTQNSELADQIEQSKTKLQKISTLTAKIKQHIAKSLTLRKNFTKKSKTLQMEKKEITKKHKRVALALKKLGPLKKGSPKQQLKIMKTRRLLNKQQLECVNKIVKNKLGLSTLTNEFILENTTLLKETNTLLKENKELIQDLRRENNELPIGSGPKDPPQKGAPKIGQVPSPQDLHLEKYANDHTRTNSPDTPTNRRLSESPGDRRPPKGPGNKQPLNVWLLLRHNSNHSRSRVAFY